MILFRSFQVIKHLKYSAVSIPPSFEEMFRKAIWAFQHQRVYDPAKEDIVHLSDIPHGFYEDLDFLGPYPISASQVFHVHNMVYLFTLK